MLLIEKMKRNGIKDFQSEYLVPFVFDDDAFRLAITLCGDADIKKLKRASKVQNFPYEHTWLEVHSQYGLRLGFKLNSAGGGSLKNGALGYYVGTELVKICKVELGSEEPLRNFKGYGDPDDDLLQNFDGLRQFLALLVMLNSPKIAEIQEVTKRGVGEGKGKACRSLIRHNQVKIRLGATTYKKYKRTGNDRRGGKRLHLVRGHLRIYKKGSVGFVRPHVRGDKEEGVNIPNYRGTT